jgi:hypothetical protein
MKKIVATLLALATTLILFNCKPDTKALEQARLEGVQKGYDSAVAINQKMLDTLIAPLKSNNKLLWDHPRSYAHTHTESYTMDPNNTTLVQSGTLVLVESDKHTHATSSEHDIIDRIIFINTKKLTKAKLDRAKMDSHDKHDLDYKKMEVTLPNGQIILIAYDVEIRP